MTWNEPVLLALALPLLWVALRTRATALVRALRLCVAITAAIALAGPRCERGADGGHLFVLVDRSRSMPGSIEREAEEWIARAEAARGDRDHLVVLEFGERARLAYEGRGEERFPGFAPFAARDASDLHAALALALSLAPREGSARLAILGDGRVDGARAREQALAAAARGVAIDVRWIERASGEDASVRELELPLEVERGAQFSFAGWVLCEQPRELSWVLRRGEQELARETRQFERGWTRLELRDRVERAGIARYELELLGAADARAENDRATGAVRVLGARGILLLNQTGELGELGAALRSADLEISAARPADVELSPAALRSYRAVLLDDLPASAFGPHLHHLARYVEQDGGGLLLGGGERSFGLGGYHLSSLDPVLPVSMELEKDRQGFGLALICLLDSSGSMSSKVESGRTKMSLAAEGAVAALSLLGRLDAGGAMLVDTAAEEILPMAPMISREAELERLAAAQSSGGGIYVRTALEAATRWTTALGGYRRHIVLFADASDAEQQDGVESIVRGLAEQGITLSVIALGSEEDPDAEFLRQCAKLGGGGCWFTARAEELPQLFAREALVASRAAYVSEPTAVRARDELLQLGDVPRDAFPAVPGYNRAFLREGAVLGAATFPGEGEAEEDAAPILAWAYRGLGRSAAFTAPLSGPAAGALPAWPGYAQLFAQLVSWLASDGEDPRYAARVVRRGADLAIELEQEPSHDAPPLEALHVVLREERGRTLRAPLEPAGERRWSATLRLPASGLWLGVVELGERRFVTLPPIAHSGSSELEPALDPDAGRALLTELAALSGGRIDPLPERLFEMPRQGTSGVDLRAWFLWTALALFLLEIARRRLGPAAPVEAPALRKLRFPTRKRRTSPSPPAAPPAPPTPTSTLDSALRDARTRARHRLNR
ncbi:MAG: VWA domain-containing protein [Planctomycetes bacterium]|nr:VWA domain-containing protein [Planctomycetota bacterium]